MSVDLDSFFLFSRSALSDRTEAVLLFRIRHSARFFGLFSYLSHWWRLEHTRTLTLSGNVVSC